MKNLIPCLLIVLLAACNLPEANATADAGLIQDFVCKDKSGMIKTFRNIDRAYLYGSSEAGPWHVIYVDGRRAHYMQDRGEVCLIIQRPYKPVQAIESYGAHP